MIVIVLLSPIRFFSFSIFEFSYMNLKPNGDIITSLLKKITNNFKIVIKGICDRLEISKNIILA